jgi:hypothetical protein
MKCCRASKGDRWTRPAKEEQRQTKDILGTKKRRVFGIRKEDVVFESIEICVCVMQQKFERDHSREYARRYQSCDGEERKGKAEKEGGVGIIRGRVHMHARVCPKTGLRSRLPNTARTAKQLPRNAIRTLALFSDHDSASPFGCW